MLLKDTPIQKKILRAIMMTSGAVLLLTCSAYFAYDIVTFRQATVRQLSTLGSIIAANSTAALAFDSKEEAEEILMALEAEPHVVAASLYDKEGNLFCFYPSTLNPDEVPPHPEMEGYRFANSYLIGFHTVVQGDKKLGTLFIKSDMGAMYDRFRLYSVGAVLVIGLSFLLAYILSRSLRKSIAEPLLSLAQTAKVISEQQNYSVRVRKRSNDEIGQLTGAFNQMLAEIEKQNNEIQLFNQKLEQNIQERTRELEAANKELESFSYSVSHDLRAPLRSIDGYSRVLLEDYYDKLDDEGKRLLKVITKNALKMGQLIDDLLAFSRIGKQHLTKVTLDMNFIARITADELKVQYPRPAEITIHPMLPVQGDSSMIKQVMTNLVSNALKYSSKKDKTIVEIGSRFENGYNIYYVKDNGAGFDMKYYDKLFGVFQRLHSANEFEGTGVGLALVQRIVSKHGGKVWAEARVGEGATFYFSLPVNDV